MPADLTDLFREHGFVPKRKTATEWSSACPACGGSKRCSIWPQEGEGRGYYWCRECNAKGDGIQFLRDYAGMSYADACRRVGVAAAAPALKTPQPPQRREARRFEATQGRRPENVDTERWREHAQKFADWAADCLRRSPGQLAWLAARGIDATAAGRYRLGYNPGERGRNCIIRPRSSWGLPEALRDDGKAKRLWLPRGIVIPQMEGDEVRRLRIRRLDADREQFNPSHKYHVVEGSEMQPLWLECTAPLCEGQGAVVVVETELDAIMLHTLAGDVAHALALGTCNVAKLPAHLLQRLRDSLVILVALDADAAGAEGWVRWRDTFPTARRWPVPAGKDPGDAFARGEDLRLWLLAGLPEGLRLAASARQSGQAVAQNRSGGETADEDARQRDEDSGLPPLVSRFFGMWQGLAPLTLTFQRSEAGELVGYRWEYPPAWGRRNFERLHAFLRFFDANPELWRWLDRNRHDRITAHNFLEMEH